MGVKILMTNIYESCAMTPIKLLNVSLGECEEIACL